MLLCKFDFILSCVSVLINTVGALDEEQAGNHVGFFTANWALWHIIRCHLRIAPFMQKLAVSRQSAFGWRGALRMPASWQHEVRARPTASRGLPPHWLEVLHLLYRSPSEAGGAITLDFVHIPKWSEASKRRLPVSCVVAHASACNDGWPAPLTLHPSGFGYLFSPCAIHVMQFNMMHGGPFSVDACLRSRFAVLKHGSCLPVP